MVRKLHPFFQKLFFQVAQLYFANQKLKNFKKMTVATICELFFILFDIVFGTFFGCSSTCNVGFSWVFHISTPKKVPRTTKLHISLSVSSFSIILTLQMTSYIFGTFFVLKAFCEPTTQNNIS